MLVSEKITLEYAEISLLKDNVLLIDFFSEETLNVDKGIEILECINRLTPDGPKAIIYNVHDKYIHSTDSLRFMGSQLTPQSHSIHARAIVTLNPAARIAANNFINLHKPIIPTKLFTELEEAISWVETHVSASK